MCPFPLFALKNLKATGNSPENIADTLAEVRLVPGPKGLLLSQTRFARWKKMPRLARNRQGFNLIELMVVIAIVGIIATISAPPIYRYVQGNRLQTSADRLAADLQYARSLSISNGTILRFTSTPAGYQLTNPVTGDLLREKNFAHGMELDQATTADFFPWGMAQPAVFNISNSSGARVINLMPTGIVEVH
jgi:type II secretion system protein H